MVLLLQDNFSSSDSEGDEYVHNYANYGRSTHQLPKRHGRKKHQRKPKDEEKPPSDWEQFKKEHGILEEIETFKGPGGRIIKKRYLSRSDTYEVGYDVGRDAPLSKRQKK